MIRRRIALVDCEKPGHSNCVLVNAAVVRHSEGDVEPFECLVQAGREIVECNGITGESDYVIKVVVPNMKAYDAFLQSQIFKVPGVASVRSNVVLREVKYETALPVG